MTARIFDGMVEARKFEAEIKERIGVVGVKPRILSVVFDEDQGSQLYTRLKFEAAARVGMDFDRLDFGFHDPVEQVREQIRTACRRNDVSGVMIQKPSKLKWNTVMETHGRGKFAAWWQSLTAVICTDKDIDCLTKQNLDLVYAGEWKLLPATVRGILLIIEQALYMRQGSLSQNERWMTDSIGDQSKLKGKKVAVIGRSEIVGRPLAAVLTQKGAVVTLCGSKTEDLGVITASAEIIVAATGVKHLIQEDLVRPGAIVIDVGSPDPDVDFEGVKDEVAFITPVPFGVGPMTVVSLLMNMVDVMQG
jgi:methylenetetrahydrofolate dehydrogenase (NADP+)/methenyltetrahydrofolate cyclohydrolase